MASRYDAIVVGGGHNGLVAAHYLARGGLAVAVFERRRVVGGPAGPLEFFPGYRGAITNSPGSLEPQIVRDLELERHGLTMVKPNPSMIMPFPDGRAFVAWRERERAEEQFRKFSEKDAVGYYEAVEFFDRFARKLRISLFQPPPTFAELMSRMRTPEDDAEFAAVMLGSIRDFLDGRIESEAIKAVIGMLSLANGNTGPSTPGTPLAMLQRPLSLHSMSIEAEHDPRKQPLRGSTGLPLGGMGSVAEAMERSLRSSGIDVYKNAGVARIRVGSSGAVMGVVLDSGEEVNASLVLSNVNPKTTLLRMIEGNHLDDALRRRLEDLKMAGAAFKLVLALDTLPRFAAAPGDLTEAFAGCQFRIGPSLDYLDRCWDEAKLGVPTRHPMFWGLVPTANDPSMAPAGRHLMSVNIWYAPYHLRAGTWDEEKHRFGRYCIDILGEYIPNLKDAIVETQFWSPKDLEEEFGLLEGHQLHGDMTPEHMFANRPVPGLSDYRTPVRGLYLCGAGTWPGGFVTGIPGHNASQQALRDLREGIESRDLGRRIEGEIQNRL